MLLIDELMELKGVSGKELAERVEVTPATISSIKNGTSFPKYDLLVKIANVLEVDIRDLFKPTKADDTETLYIKRDGQFTPIGKIKRE